MGDGKQSITFDWRFWVTIAGQAAVGLLALGKLDQRVSTLEATMLDTRNEVRSVADGLYSRDQASRDAEGAQRELSDIRNRTYRLENYIFQAPSGGSKK